MEEFTIILYSYALTDFVTKQKSFRTIEIIEKLRTVPFNTVDLNYTKFLLGLKYFIEDNSYPLTINCSDTPKAKSSNTISLLDEQGLTIGYIEFTVSCSKLVSNLVVVNTTTNTKTDIDVDSMIEDITSTIYPVIVAIFDALLQNPKSAIE